MLEQLSNRGFDVLPLHHAAAILQADLPQAITEIEMTLSELSIPVIELVAGGGGEAKLTQWLRKQLAGHGWVKRNIEIKKYIDGTETMSLSHEIDHMKTFGGWVAALEIEWNNKDPFFDRDLENFKRLHAEGAISVGIIITRGSTLQLEMRDIIRRFAKENEIESFEDLEKFDYAPTPRQRRQIEERVNRGKISFLEVWVNAFVSDKFGEATTHWRKLEDRVRRGVGNPCPLVLIGIPSQVITF